MNSQFYLAIAVLFSLIERLTHRSILKSKNYSHSYTIFYQLGGACLLVSFIPIESTLIDFSLIFDKWVYFTFAGLAWMGYCITSFSADQHIPVSHKVVLSRIRILWVWGLGYIFFQECLTFNKALGGALLILGVFLIAGKSCQLSAKGTLLEVCASVFVSIAMTIDKVLMQWFPASLVAIGAYLCSGLFLSLVRPRFFLKAFILPNLIGWMVFIPMLSGSLSYVFFVTCLKEIDLSVVVPLYQTSGILALIAGHIIFRESGAIRFKIMCGILTLAGTILISLKL